MLRQKGELSTKKTEQMFIVERMLRRIAGEETHVEKRWIKMPGSYDTLEGCAYCMQIFTVFRNKGKIYSTSIPAVQMGDGLWLCREHDFTLKQIEALKTKIRKGQAIKGGGEI